jgi:hypothetical protein
MSTLSFEPLIPLALWLFLAGAGLILLAWYSWTRPAAAPRRRFTVMIALMTLSLSTVLLVLLNPTWLEIQTPLAGKPTLTILVDATASMATQDLPQGQTRYQGAAQLAQAFAGNLQDRFEVRTLTFAESLSSCNPADLTKRTPDGQLTDLAAALLGGLDENRPQGQAILLLSDGIHNAGVGSSSVLEAVRLARSMACPIYARTLGGDVEIKDLAVELRSPRELAYLGQKVPVSVFLKHRGLAGARTNVVLSQDGHDLERRVVSLTNQPAVEVLFLVSQDKAGLYRYEVRADPVPGELSLANNQALLQLQVVTQPIKVLLLEGKPYWDSKFLMRTLMADPSIELDAIVRMSANRLHRRVLTRAASSPKPGAKPDAGDKAGPQVDLGSVREDWKVLGDFSEFMNQGEGLRSYQIIVLGRDAELFLNDSVSSQLRTWVFRDGGCLVCSRGQPTAQVNQSLGQMLPVRWTPTRESRFLMTLTERGRDLRWFPSLGAESESDAISHLPTLATSARPEKPKPLAVVLATAGAALPEAESPVVSYQPYGAGRVIVLEGSGMWRWAFLPPEQKQLDDMYRSLWHSLLRWLVSSTELLPGQKLALRSDKVIFSTLESASASLLIREEAAQGKTPAIELRGQGVSQSITPVALGDEPGTFHVPFGKLPEGRYEAQVAGTASGNPSSKIAFDVRSSFEEQLDLKARPDLMARIAHESGGLVLEGFNTDDLLKQFQEHQAQGRILQVRRITAWDRWWVLVAILGVWAVAWGLRRSSGLV